MRVTGFFCERDQPLLAKPLDHHYPYILKLKK